MLERVRWSPDEVALKLEEGLNASVIWSVRPTEVDGYWDTYSSLSWHLAASSYVTTSEYKMATNSKSARQTYTGRTVEPVRMKCGEMEYPKNDSGDPSLTIGTLVSILYDSQLRNPQSNRIIAKFMSLFCAFRSSVTPVTHHRTQIHNAHVVSMNIH